MDVVEQTSFQLISLAGDALDELIEANEAAKLANTKLVEERLENAKKAMIEAHNQQTKLLTLEAKGESIPVNVLLVHAQDTLMNTVIADTLIRETIAANLEIANLKKKVTELERKISNED